MRALIMVEDVLADLLAEDPFDSISGIDSYRKMKSSTQLNTNLKKMEENLRKMGTHFNVKHIHKMAHVIISLSNGNEEAHFVILPTFDRKLENSPEKFNQWIDLKKLLVAQYSFEEDKTSKQNENDRPCFISFVEESIEGSRVSIIVYVESSAEAAAESIPLLKEAHSLRDDMNVIASESPLKISSPKSNNFDIEEDEEEEVEDYASKLVQEINEFVSETQTLMVWHSLIIRREEIACREQKMFHSICASPCTIIPKQYQVEHLL